MPTTDQRAYLVHWTAITPEVDPSGQPWPDGCCARHSTTRVADEAALVAFLVALPTDATLTVRGVTRLEAGR